MSRFDPTAQTTRSYPTWVRSCQRETEQRGERSRTSRVSSKANTEQRGLIAALGKVIGLADSNTWVENANFTAHHMLMNSSRTLLLHSPERHELTAISGGYHISNKEQRGYSIAFLRRVQENMGFQTQSTIALLESQ